MKLSLAQLDQFASGISSSTSDDGNWRPVRMPDPMTPIYAEPESAKIRMYCDAGVRLRFTSNTRSIRLTLKFGVRAREIFQSTLIVDGTTSLSFGPDTFTPQ